MRSPWSSNGSTGSFLFLFLPVIYKGRPLVRLVKVMGFSVVMYGYKSWTIKKVKWSEMAQSCPTLWDPMDWSLPGSSIRGIFRARILEWVAISFSRRSSQPREWTRVFCTVSRPLYRLSTQNNNNNRHMLKGHRSQLEEASNDQIWANLNNKINNDSNGL